MMTTEKLSISLQQLDSRLSGCLVDLGGEEEGLVPKFRSAAVAEFKDQSPLRRQAMYNNSSSSRASSRFVVVPGDKKPAGTIGSSSSGSSENEYHVICHSSMETFARTLMDESNRTINSPKTFFLYECSWGKFSDMSDNIKISCMTSPTHFKGKNILFVASFHNNDVTMSQFHVISFLCECLAASVTVLLPYYSTGTMERVDINDDGVIPTASTLALLFNGLPSVGRPIRLMTYDLHTLQNRFYLTGHCVATLHTAVPLLIEVIIRKSQQLVEAGQSAEEGGNNNNNPINAVAFPDEGAHKRFGSMFKKVSPALELIVCSKVRDGTKRIVKIAEGNAGGKHVVILDDQTKSGGTLIECARALKKSIGGVSGAAKVSGYVTHAICTDEFWSKFIPAVNYEKYDSGGNRINSPARPSPDDYGTPSIDLLDTFYCTDSFPIENEMKKQKSGNGLSWMKDELLGDGQKVTHEYRASITQASLDLIRLKIKVLSLTSLVLKDL